MKPPGLCILVEKIQQAPKLEIKPAQMSYLKTPINFTQG